MDLPATIFPAIATVTAAFIAAFVAFVSSVLSKEQKTSEFRYAWLNSVLDDIAKFTGAAESLTAAVWSLSKNEDEVKARAFLANAEPQIRDMLTAYYRARIRLYPQEHLTVHQALDSLQALLLKGDVPDPAKTDLLVRGIVTVSHEALKEEWGRVKRGETIYRWTKYISIGVMVLVVAVGIFGYPIYKALFTSNPQTLAKPSAPVITPENPQRSRP